MEKNLGTQLLEAPTEAEEVVDKTPFAITRAMSAVVIQATRLVQTPGDDTNKKRETAFQSAY